MALTIRRRISFISLALLALWVGKIMAGFMMSSQPFLVYGSFPEQVLEHTAAQNFVHRGFLRTAFLADYSTSPNELDHPYLYTHMPSGPAVALGALFKCGADLLQARFFFASLSLLGALLFFWLILEVTGVPEIALVLFIIYSFDYGGFIKWSDHFTHSFYGIDYFGPLLFYLRFLKKNSTANLIVFALCIALGALTNYIAALPALIAIAALHLIFHRDSRDSKKLMGYAFGAFGAILTLHLLQNALALGVKLTVKELLSTLGNRMLGWPPKTALANLYARHKIVLWGADRPPPGWWRWLSTAFAHPVFKTWAGWLMLLEACALILGIIEPKPSARFRPIGLASVIFLAPYSWYLVFVSHGSIYPLPFVHRFFSIGLLMTALYLLYLGILDLWAHRPGPATAKTAFYRNPLSRLAFLTLGIGLFLTAANSRIKENSRAYGMDILDRFTKHWEIALISTPSIDQYERLGNLLSNQVLLTNMDGTITNFFAPRALVFGGCRSDAFLLFNAANCPSTFLDEKTKEALRPDSVLISYKFIPGYQECTSAACLDALLAKLKKSYVLRAQEKDAWVLFDIPKNVGGARH